jgi:hypothetical protein
MTFGLRQFRKRETDRRASFCVPHGRFGRAGLWAALFAVFCQIVIPTGHDAIALLLGDRCPALDLAVAGDGQHRDAGPAEQMAGAHASQPAAQDHDHSCPIFQTFTYLAPLGSAGPPPLSAPQFAALHRFPADWTGLVPAFGSFSRPFPRAPPANA